MHTAEGTRTGLTEKVWKVTGSESPTAASSSASWVKSSLGDTRSAGTPVATQREVEPISARAALVYREHQGPPKGRLHTPAAARTPSLPCNQPCSSACSHGNPSFSAALSPARVIVNGHRGTAVGTRHLCPASSSRGGLTGLAGVTTRPAGCPSGGVPPAAERQSSTYLLPPFHHAVSATSSKW